MNRQQQRQDECDRAEAMMVVSSDGGIVCATPSARRWLSLYLDARAEAVRAPAKISEWLAAPQGRRGQCRPLIIDNEEAQLMITLLHPQVDSVFSLLLTERPLGASSVRLRCVGLTKRQTEVRALMQKGKSNKEIARDLGLSEATIKRHVEDVLGKLNVDNRTAAAAATGMGASPLDGSNKARVVGAPAKKR